MTHFLLRNTSKMPTLWLFIIANAILFGNCDMICVWATVGISDRNWEAVVYQEFQERRYYELTPIAFQLGILGGSRQIELGNIVSSVSSTCTAKTRQFLWRALGPRLKYWLIIRPNFITTPLILRS